MKQKTLFFLPIIIFSFLIPQQINALEGSSVPIVEVLDLKIDGSASGGVFVNTTKEFLVISRVIWNLEFKDQSVDFTGFGSGNALTNGINVYYNDVSLLDNANISKNDDFGHGSYDISIHSDDQGANKDNILLSRWSFSKFVESSTIAGLIRTSEKRLAFHIQDDLLSSSAFIELTVTIEGYKRIDDNVIQSFDTYYPGVINPITIKNLIIGLPYQILVNTSTLSINQWINFTADDSEVIIQTFFENIHDTDKYISFYLYEDSGFLDSFSVIIQQQNLSFLDSLLQVIPTIVLLFMGLLIALTIIGEAKRRL